jgi:hypothetical protein
MIPLMGFLPAHDPRVRGTIEAVERELVEGDFVLRYRTADTGDVDGLTGREGAFLACSFWLADCLSLLGRDRDARQLLERLLGLRNDLGLLSEEYDPVAGRLIGNFPQAFSHVSLVNSVSKIGGHEKPTSEHVALGLARRAYGRGKSTSGGSHHMGGFTARSLLTKLAGSGDAGSRENASQLIKAAVAAPQGRTGSSTKTRRKATAKPTGERMAKSTSKAPASAVEKEKTTAAKTKGKTAAAKKTTATKKAAAREVPAKKRAAESTATTTKSARR